MTNYRVTIEDTETGRRFAKLFRALNETAAIHAAYSMLRHETADYYVVSVVTAA